MLLIHSGILSGLTFVPDFFLECTAISGPEIIGDKSGGLLLPAAGSGRQQVSHSALVSISLHTWLYPKDSWGCPSLFFIFYFSRGSITSIPFSRASWRMITDKIKMKFFRTRAMGQLTSLAPGSDNRCCSAWG
jgi:hypothetical protein